MHFTCVACSAGSTCRCRLRCADARIRTAIVGFVIAVRFVGHSAGIDPGSETVSETAAVDR